MLAFHFSFLISHFPFLVPVTVLAHAAMPGFPKVEAVVAYPPAAYRAAVELQMRFKVGFVKGGAVFACP